MSLYQSATLKNGTRVLLVPSHDTQAVTVLALYEVGSRYELGKIGGASHFVEHLMFKGTKRRPTTMAISHELDSVGAEYNAFTGKDYTGYYVRLQADRVGMAVDLLHDLLYRSLFKAEEIERERQVILEEINMYEDNPIMRAEEDLEELVYDGSTLGRNIAGTRASVAALSRKDLARHHAAWYAPSRTVLAVAGRIDDGIIAMLEKTFGTVPAKKISARGWKPAAFKTGAPKLRLTYKETEQVQVVLGFPAFPYRHKKLAALSVLATILGGGMSSRLFTEVRERRGLAYSVHASLSPYQDVGNVAILAGLAKAKVDEGLRTILAEIGKVVRSGVTPEELTRAKEYIKGRTILGLEESSALAEFFAKQELLTRTIDAPERKIERVMAVRREDVQAVAREVFRTSRLSAAIIGPFKDRARFLKLLKIPA